MIDLSNIAYMCNIIDILPRYFAIVFKFNKYIIIFFMLFVYETMFTQTRFAENSIKNPVRVHQFILF